MAYRLIGKDFVPPDVPGKVTGRIKYAEDYARDGMVYARLLTSPVPHGRVVAIDASEALAMDGVFGILTADDVYPVPFLSPLLIINTCTCPVTHTHTLAILNTLPSKIMANQIHQNRILHCTCTG